LRPTGRRVFTRVNAQLPGSGRPDDKLREAFQRFPSPLKLKGRPLP
jgi:hypothetical protein